MICAGVVRPSADLGDGAGRSGRLGHERLVSASCRTARRRAAGVRRRSCRAQTARDSAPDGCRPSGAGRLLHPISCGTAHTPRCPPLEIRGASRGRTGCPAARQPVSAARDPARRDALPRTARRGSQSSGRAAVSRRCRAGPRPGTRRGPLAPARRRRAAHVDPLDDALAELLGRAGAAASGPAAGAGSPRRSSRARTVEHPVVEALGRAVRGDLRPDDLRPSGPITPPTATVGVPAALGDAAGRCVAPSSCGSRRVRARRAARPRRPAGRRPLDRPAARAAARWPGPAFARASAAARRGLGVAELAVAPARRAGAPGAGRLRSRSLPAGPRPLRRTRAHLAADARRPARRAAPPGRRPAPRR